MLTFLEYLTEAATPETAFYHTYSKINQDSLNLSDKDFNTLKKLHSEAELTENSYTHKKTLKNALTKIDSPDAKSITTYEKTVKKKREALDKFKAFVNQHIKNCHFKNLYDEAIEEFEKCLSNHEAIVKYALPAIRLVKLGDKIDDAYEKIRAYAKKYPMFFKLLDDKNSAILKSRGYVTLYTHWAEGGKLSSGSYIGNVTYQFRIFDFLDDDKVGTLDKVSVSVHILG